MGKLIYSAIASLDLYVEDASGSFRWAAPDEEVHAFVNELERPVGTYLYGRRMYDTMLFWETAGLDESDDDDGPVFRDYAEVWRAAEKVVYSRTLTAPRSERTRIEPEFDASAVRELKQSLPHDLSVGGSELAGQALAAGVVDQLHLFLHPVVVGGGKPALPAGVPLDLELVAQDRFASGVVHLHYEVR